MSNRATQKQNSLWLLAAMAAPITQAASNCSWISVLVVTLLCGAIQLGMERILPESGAGRWIGAVQWLWMLLVISEFLHWSMLCWPDYKSYHAVPLILLALAAYASCRGAEKAAAASSVLFWFLVVLLGAVLLSGIKQMHLANLKPRWGMQTAHLITVLLIPSMGNAVGKKIPVIGYALAVSIVTTGVLSMERIMELDAPFYEMSRSLTLLGIGQRFESLVAAGMTLGYFALTSYLLSITANAWELGKRQCRSVWISAVFVALVFLSGMRLNSRLLAAGTLAVWVILPLLKIFGKILKTTIDK